jgi:hypothetical protein
LVAQDKIQYNMNKTVRIIYQHYILSKVSFPYFKTIFFFTGFIIVHVYFIFVLFNFINLLPKIAFGDTKISGDFYMVPFAIILFAYLALINNPKKLNRVAYSVGKVNKFWINLCLYLLFLVIFLIFISFF